MKKEEKKIEISLGEYEELKEAKAKAEEYFDRLHRLQAEYENARKRMDKERIEFIKFSNESLISQLISIVENLERSLGHAGSEDMDSVVKGVKMVSKELSDILEKNGLEKVKAVGEKFDPHLHEAIMQVECEDKEDGIIVEEIAAGYILNGRLLKPAAVKVGKRGQRTEGRGQKTEDRGQKTEDRRQRTEDRGQKTEDRGQRAEGRGEEF